jgi:hypothetical protein
MLIRLLSSLLLGVEWNPIPVDDLLGDMGPATLEVEPDARR